MQQTTRRWSSAKTEEKGTLLLLLQQRDWNPSNREAARLFDEFCDRI